MNQRGFWDTTWWLEYPVYLQLFELITHVGHVMTQVVIFFLMLASVVVSSAPVMLGIVPLYLIYRGTRTVAEYYMDMDTSAYHLVHVIFAFSVTAMVCNLCMEYTGRHAKAGQHWVSMGLVIATTHIAAVVYTLAGYYRMTPREWVETLLFTTLGYLMWVHGHDLLRRLLPPCDAKKDDDTQ